MTQELTDNTPTNLGDDDHLSGAAIDEKSIDAILGQEDTLTEEQEESRDEFYDGSSLERGADDVERKSKEQDHEDGHKSGKEETKAGAEKTQASDQGASQNASSGSASEALDEESIGESDSTQKLEEELTRNKKWGHDLARKLKSYQSKLESYVNDGKLTVDEAQDLYAQTMHDDMPQEESLYDRCAKIWDAEIQNLRKYAPDENLDKHIMGFQAKMKMSSQEEISETFKSFEKEEDPVRLTRQMLKEGASYYDKVLSKTEPYGGMEGYVTHMEKALEKAHAKVDALKQEVVKLKSEGYLSSAGYSLPSQARERDKGKYQKDMALESVFERARQGRI